MKGGGTHHRIPRGAGAETGQTMAEYAVILGLVTVTAVAAYQLLGGPIVALIGQVAAAFTQ
ncbi:MAG TPA: hypothetical protein VFJ77_06280 [Gaiellaceae bacterium]|nr:hypothetical protein [Gaiellaceae bacterium]